MLRILVVFQEKYEYTPQGLYYWGKSKKPFKGRSFDGKRGLSILFLILSLSFRQRFVKYLVLKGAVLEDKPFDRPILEGLGPVRIRGSTKWYIYSYLCIIYQLILSIEIRRVFYHKI